MSTYKSRWDVCDYCGTAVIVENEDGLPVLEEWDGFFPQCPLCGESLPGGSWDPLAQADMARYRTYEAVVGRFEKALKSDDPEEEVMACVRSLVGWWRG